MLLHTEGPALSTVTLLGAGHHRWHRPSDSLFTGVYNITGGEDGWDMFFITRVPGLSRWHSPEQRWPCVAW